MAVRLNLQTAEWLRTLFNDSFLFQRSWDKKLFELLLISVSLWLKLF